MMPSSPLKLVFMGTPDFSVPCLQTLIDSCHDVTAVYCQPPRPSGRGHKLRASPIQQLAQQYDIPVYHPINLKSAEVQEQFQNHQADAAIVAAYGLLLPKVILEAYPMGCINVHPSKLPRWRGAAPLNRTIMAGERETALCIMQMDEGLDTGDILYEQNITIERNTTAGQLHDQMAELAGPAILHTLTGLQAQTITPHSQAIEGVSYANKISKSEASIDWNQSAETVLHHILGLNPYPAAFFEYHGEKIKIHAAEAVNISGTPGHVLDNSLTIACQQGAIRPATLQRPGKKPITVDEFLRGFPLPSGTIL